MAITPFQAYEFSLPYPRATISEKLALVDQDSIISECSGRITAALWSGEQINGKDIMTDSGTTELAAVVNAGGKLVKGFVDGNLVYLQSQHPRTGELITDADMEDIREFWVRQLAHGLVAQELSYYLSQADA